MKEQISIHSTLDLTEDHVFLKRVQYEESKWKKERLDYIGNKIWLHIKILFSEPNTILKSMLFYVLAIYSQVVCV